MLLAKELAKDKNFSVTMIVGDFFDGQALVESVPTTGRPITLFKGPRCTRRRGWLETVIDILKLFRLIKRSGADVVVLRGGGSLAGSIAFLTQRILGKKFVYSSAHDRDSNGIFFKTHPWIMNRMFDYGLKHADALICQHEDQQQHFQTNLGLHSTIIKTIYPISSDAEFPNRREDILWVSRLEPWKQPELFVQLALAFPEEHFVLITNSSSTDIQKKWKDIKNLTIREKIPFEDMDRHFESAKLFVNTSLSEGFPNTFVQAAKNKTPILSLSVDPGHLLERFQMGLGCHGDFSQLQQELKKALEHPTMLLTMGDHAFQYAKEFHSAEKNVEKIKHLIREVMHSADR